MWHNSLSKIDLGQSSLLKRNLPLSSPPLRGAYILPQPATPTVSFNACLKVCNAYLWPHFCVCVCVSICVCLNLCQRQLQLPHHPLLYTSCIFFYPLLLQFHVVAVHVVACRVDIFAPLTFFLLPPPLVRCCSNSYFTSNPVFPYESYQMQSPGTTTVKNTNYAQLN